MKREFQCEHCGNNYFADDTQIGKMLCHSECGGLTFVGGIARQIDPVKQEILKIQSAIKWMRRLALIIAVIVSMGAVLFIFTDIAVITAAVLALILMKGFVFYLVYARYLWTGRYILCLWLALFFWPPLAITSIFTYRDLKKREKFFAETASVVTVL